MLNLIKRLFGLSASTLSPEDLAAGTVIDVRTPAEFKQGHASGSLNVPLQQLGDSLPKLRKLKQPIITYCRSGSRSALATRHLTAAGLRALNGGTWQKVQSQKERCSQPETNS